MEEIKIVDIIIPAYNHKIELERALDSIVSQTKRDKCIVTVIDDCSEEDLFEVVKKYKNKLKIKYIRNKENLKYPGLVRQVGIDNTISPFIIFLDSDDMLSPTAVEMANSEMLKTNADMIIGYFYSQEKGGLYHLRDEHDTTWLHGNVYRRSFLEKNNIRFSSGYNEDGAFNTQCYLLAENIAILPAIMSYWLDCGTSLTREGNNFCLRHSNDVVSTLRDAYENIIERIGYTPSVLFNFGNHLGLFYKIGNEIDELIATGTGVLSNSVPEKFWKEIESICSLFNKQENKLDWDKIKDGFMTAYLKYQDGSLKMPINDFLEACQFSKYISISLSEITNFAKEYYNENNNG